MPTIEIVFHIQATGPIPADHGYPLYAAVSRILPAVHAENGIGIHPIRGQFIGNRQMTLLPTSRLVLRASDTHIAELIVLAGKQLDIAGQPVRVGVPQVRGLVPAPALRSRLVTIKLKDLTGNSPDDDEQSRLAFTEAVRRKLDSLGISTEARITLGKRRTIRIHHKEVFGYEVILEALTAEESLRIQENGESHDPHAGFSRRHMGCAMFAPMQAVR